MLNMLIKAPKKGALFEMIADDLEISSKRLCQKFCAKKVKVTLLAVHEESGQRQKTIEELSKL